MYGNNGPFSYSPRGFSQDDLPQQRRPFQQDNLKGSSLQRDNMSRPSGKSIYMQRKEYSGTLNRQSDSFQFRIEHLFTCELDGQEMKTVNDCVRKLKQLDTKGRLWSQEMIMEIQGGYLLLSDIETKTELEALPLSSIVNTKAVLDSCAYNSLLTITVQDRRKLATQVFMFQCEETGAELIKADLDKVVQKGGAEMEPRREQFDIRVNLENVIGKHTPESFQRNRPPPPPLQQREMSPPPMDHPPPYWANREPEVFPERPSLVHNQQDEMLPPPDSSLGHLEVFPEQTDMMRNTEIFNHVLDDLEIFMAKVNPAANAPPPQQEKKKKKGFMKKKSKKQEAPAINNLPPWEEYVSCLQKIKYGLNLLGQLEGTLTNPSAPDFVHIFFSNLGIVVPLYPADLAQTVISPLLTDTALRLVSQVVTQEEDQLWRFLGDAWNIPRSRWPDDNVPLYIPEFYDGWQPPAPPPISPSPTLHDNQISRSNSQRFSTRQQWQPEAPIDNSQWANPPAPIHSREQPMQMRVIYNFMARNSQELSIMKGEVVEVIHKSNQMWLVRNSRNEEGSVPPNVLEPINGRGPIANLPPQQDTHGPMILDMSSTPAEVKAWLQSKGFSKITVLSLGVLSGQQILGMSKEEIRTVCPEEAGKVFFQLQAVRSAIALNSEQSGRYNDRYNGRY